VTYRSAAEVRTAVARYLADAAEIGTDHLVADLSDVLFNTTEHVVEAAAMAISEGGDAFPAELSTLVADEQENPDRLAFRVAMALYTP
jgi:hypothetical protein